MFDRQAVIGSRVSATPIWGRLGHESEIITLYMLQQSGRLPYENNADKAQGFYKDRKLSLDADEVFQLCCEKKLGRAIVASRPRYQRADACHVFGKQIAGAVTGNSGLVLAITEPVGGNYTFGGFLTATELSTS
jgi:hypothetical protein